MKYLIAWILVFFHVEVLAQVHPLIDSLFMIGQLQISRSGNVKTDHVIPQISNENGELVFDQLHNKNKLLVIKSESGGILKIGDNNFPIIKDYLHHFPIYKEKKVFHIVNEPLRIEPLDSLYSFLLPDFYLIYSYPEMSRSSGIGRQNLNYFTECFIKNFNENNKNLSAVNSSTSFIELGTKYEILNFKGFNSPHAALFEGFYGSGKNGLETVDHIKFWNHEYPNLYQRKFNIWSCDDAQDIQENNVIIGFRDVRLKDNSLFVNNKKTSLKSYFVTGAGKSVSDSSLLLLKKLHFNCLVLGSKVPDRVFELCDSIGIYAIQVVSNALFPNIRNWVDYHIFTKEHPSLIAWLYTEIDKSILEVIDEIDDNRIIFSNRNLFFPIFFNLENLNKNETKELVGFLQPIKFYVNSTRAMLEIQFMEYSGCVERLIVKVKVLNQDSVLVGHQQISFISAVQEKTIEIKLNDLPIANSEEQFLFQFELVFKEDAGIYEKGEILGYFDLSVQKRGDIFQIKEPKLPELDKYMIRDIK
jgi:hypothetical protein